MAKAASPYPRYRARALGASSPVCCQPVRLLLVIGPMPWNIWSPYVRGICNGTTFDHQVVGAEGLEPPTAGLYEDVHSFRSHVPLLRYSHHYSGRNE